jgi:hypothetical protein
MADSLNRMITMAKELKRFSENMSKETSPVFTGFTFHFADKVRDRMLKGLSKGYDVRGKQFKHLTKFSKHIRRRDKIRNLFGSPTPQFGETRKELESRLEKQIINLKPKTIGGYNFSPNENGNVLFKTGKLVEKVGDSIEGNPKGEGRYPSQVVFPKKTTVRISTKNLDKYQLMQNRGFKVPGSHFSETWNVKGKRVPPRNWYGVPQTYKEGHPGWRNEMGELAKFLKTEFGKVIKGGKGSLTYRSQRKR